MKVLDVLSHPRVRPIAMSRNGEMWLKNANLEPLYVPHGVDTEVFKPDPAAGAYLKSRLEIPEDAFLVGMVAANAGWNPNLSRKSFPQAFDAMGQFMQKREDVFFYVHTRMDGGGRGHDLDFLVDLMGIPRGRFRAPQPNAWHLGVMDEHFVAGVYNSLDVLLNPSMGEGFGIPIIEAQACGVPVIASNHSAMTELTHAGWLVQGDRWFNGPPFLSFSIMPSLDGIVGCLEEAYGHRDNDGLRFAAREFAKGYDADRVMDRYWKPALEELAKPREVKPLKLAPPPRSGMNPLTSREARRAEEHPGKKKAGRRRAR